MPFKKGTHRLSMQEVKTSNGIQYFQDIEMVDNITYITNNSTLIVTPIGVTKLCIVDPMTQQTYTVYELKEILSFIKSKLSTEEYLKYEQSAYENYT